MLGLAASLGGCGFLTGGAEEQQDVTVEFDGNLDAREPVERELFDLLRPAETARISAQVTVRTEARQSRTLSFFFLKADVSVFEYHVLVSGEVVEPPTDAIWVEIGAGELIFDGEGALADHEPTKQPKVQFVETDRPQAFRLDFGLPTAEGGDGRDGITQYAQSTSINHQGSTD